MERSLRRIARYADGWMSNQIELAMFKDYQGRLREMVTEEGRDPNAFKTVSILRRFGKPRSRASVSLKRKAFSMPITKKTSHEKAWKSGPPAAPSNVASTACVDLSTPGSTTSLFARSAPI